MDGSGRILARTCGGTMAKSSDSFSVNDRINHHVYGLGTITEVNVRHTTIEFDENGTRKFLTDVVKLEKSDTPAPAKPTRAKKARKATTKTAKPAKTAKAVK
jgi:hypothetical protein